MRLRLSTALALGAVILATLAIGGAQASTEGPEAGNRIGIIRFDYRPDPNTVAPGTTVMVANRDGMTNGIPHSLTSDDGRFDTGVFRRGIRAFTAPMVPGAYPYHCEVHPFMEGTLIVSS